MQPEIRTEFVRCNLCKEDSGKVILRFDQQSILSKSSIELNLSSMTVFPSIIECRNCGLVYVNPRWIFPAGLMPYTEEAEETYFVATRELRKVGFDNLIRGIKNKYHLPYFRAIDVGCGDGIMLNQCREAGIDCDGFEISESLVQKLQIQFGKQSILSGSLDAVSENQYDVAFLINVIEHLPDPERVLKNIYKILKPGGLVFIHTPNYGGLPAKLSGVHWHQLEPLSHLYYFDQHTLEIALKNGGFNPKGNFYLKSNSNLKGSIQYILNFLHIYIDNGLGIVAERPLHNT